jgi:hypothetical protein
MNFIFTAEIFLVSEEIPNNGSQALKIISKKG